MRLIRAQQSEAQFFFKTALQDFQVLPAHGDSVAIHQNSSFRFAAFHTGLLEKLPELKELLQIIGVTLRMSFFSTTISCLIGLPLGALIGTRRFKGKSFVKKLMNGATAKAIFSG